MLPVICIGAIDFIAGVGGDSGLIVTLVRAMPVCVQEYQCCLRGPAVGSVTVIGDVDMPQPLGVVLL